MNSVREYEYVMDMSEIREFCRFAYVEQFKFRKWTWVRAMLIIVVEAFLIPEAALIVIILMMLSIITTGIYNYRSTVKLLEGQLWQIFCIENGRLRVLRGDCSEVPCSSIQFIRRTRRLLMLGYLQGPKRPAWFVMPLRIFRDEQELEAFLSLFRSPQAGAGGEGYGSVNRTEERAEMAEQEPEYMRFSYLLDGERWVRFQKGAADIVNSGSLGKPTRTYGMIIWGCVMAVVLVLCTCFAAGMFSWWLFYYSLALAVWLVLRLFARNPEKRIRKQLTAPEVAVRECGPWQVSLTEEGVTVSMPMDMKNFYSWTSLEWLVEKEEAFYLFHKDKKHFIMIAKECFVSWEQVDVFHQICADKGIKKVMPKKARYVPGWLTWVILGLIIFVGAGVLVAKIYLDSRSETENVYVRIPLEEQVEVLTSLGLHVPEETVESVRNSMVQYELYDLVEMSPYTWLLMDMGAPDYDEDWNLVGYSDEVFWFDFEGFDRSMDYIDVLNGMKALAQGSPIDGISDIRVNMEDVDWERGRGTLTVSLNWEGQTYQYDMEVYNDWIDGEVLEIFNSLLEQEASQKRFYVTGDDGQGAIVFFCTEEWAEEFTQKTGLVLE